MDYCLFTSAKNEDRYLEATIESVLAQTRLPRRWIIVSDGSTDRTDEIILSCASRRPFVRYIHHESPAHHDFQSKARAINIACEMIQNEDAAMIANLDADITIPPDYYERIMDKLGSNSRLGIAGGTVKEKVSGDYRRQNTSLNSVAGGIQAFRRECFAEIAPYTPMRFGGEDAAMEIRARALGWEVAMFPEIEVLHHRPVGSSAGHRLLGRYRLGKVLFSLGYHPLFELCRCVRRLGEGPPLLGSLAELLGYIGSRLNGTAVELEATAVNFLRREQMERLQSLFRFARS
jgi:GT2 family glycosyltransferase